MKILPFPGGVISPVVVEIDVVCLEMVFSVVVTMVLLFAVAMRDVRFVAVVVFIVVLGVVEIDIVCLELVFPEVATTVLFAVVWEDLAFVAAVVFMVVSGVFTEEVVLLKVATCVVTSVVTKVVDSNFVEGFTVVEWLPKSKGPIILVTT